MPPDFALIPASTWIAFGVLVSVALAFGGWLYALDRADARLAARTRAAGYVRADGGAAQGRDSGASRRAISSAQDATIGRDQITADERLRRGRR